MAIDGKRQYVAYLPLTAADWSVALVIPRQNIERQLLPFNAIALTVVGLTLAMITLLWKVQTFEQGEKLYNKLEGTGLGLAISQQIVKLMGSQIQVRSRLKEDSTFFFSLNVEIPPLESLSTLQSLDFKSASAVSGYKGERKTILIVNDRWEN